MKGNSLKLRAVIFASCVVVVFLSIAGYTLYNAFSESFKRNAESAMQAQIVALLSSIDFTDDGEVYFDSIPFPELSIPNSGMYAEVWAADKLLWRSESLIGRPLPDMFLSDNSDAYQFHNEHHSVKKYLLSRKIEWEGSSGELLNLNFIVAVNSEPYLEQISEYGRSILFWLALLGGFLILLQAILLTWLFRPLSKVLRQLHAIERGGREQFDDDFPSEIKGLTNSLNQYVLHEKKQIAKQKESLANLAHSLKTPVAVIKNSIQTPEVLSGLINEQLQRIDDTIDYQLNKANLAARKRYHSGKKVATDLQRVVNAISKLAELSNKKIITEIDNDVEFYGDVGDLIEVVGNLLENANKWADSVIVFQIKNDKQVRKLQLNIIDDGPGISNEKLKQITQRGLRLDEKKEGYGIGLSLVADIVDSYNGVLKFKLAKGRHAGFGFEHGLHVSVII